MDTRRASASSSLRDQQREFTRARLVDAARAVIARRGYVATTIEDIVAEAGASRATFYLHFSAKPEVVKAIYEVGLETAVERYRQLDAVLVMDAGDRRRHLLAWLAGFLDLWRAGGGANDALMEASAVDPDIERQSLSMTPTLIDTLHHAPWCTGGAGGHDGVARQRALMLEVMTRRLLFLASSGRMAFDDDALLDYLVELWADVLGLDDARSADARREKSV